MHQYLHVAVDGYFYMVMKSAPLLHWADNSDAGVTKLAWQVKKNWSISDWADLHMGHLDRTQGNLMMGCLIYNV